MVCADTESYFVRIIGVRREEGTLPGEWKKGMTKGGRTVEAKESEGMVEMG